MTNLEQRIRERLRCCGDLGFDGHGTVTVASILNYGGFVNRSFRATDGRRAYQVKLSSDAHSLRCLMRWRALGDILTEDYRAPALREWIEIPGTAFAGPVFDWIEGERPAAIAGDVARELVPLVRRLHADRRLAAELARLGDAATSCAVAYLSTYHDRFVKDLEPVRAAPPPFVARSLVDWLAAEVASIADLVSASDAFAAPATAPSHRDLWLDNLLVTRSCDLYVLDWDEVGLGDPMMDWAMLFGPTRARVEPAPAEVRAELAPSAAERERLAVYARASLLDWTIDPLADWIDAENEPQHGAAVRASNHRVHEEALSLYRELYV